MNRTSPIDSCIVVGAGISGLLAATRLQEHCLRVVVLDKGSGVGGRMATRRIEQGRCDHGAQFFTARDPVFMALAASWLESGAAREWCRGFPGVDGKTRPDAHPRYRGADGMVSIPKHLAHGLDIRSGERVISTTHRGRKWSVRTANGTVYEADSLLLTPPVPQTLALLDAGSVRLEDSELTALEAISYEPCIAVLALMSGPTALPIPGAVEFPAEHIDWIADNQQKGISPLACCVTIHAGAEFSRAHQSTDDTEVGALLLRSAGSLLPHPARIVQVHRWRYARPVRLHPSPYLYAAGTPPLAFAGDAFGAPRIEGAAISGLAAASALLAAAKPATLL